MKVVERDEDLAEAFSMTRKEALQNFGNAAVYMEKYLGKPRHIELQVIGDSTEMPSICSNVTVRCSAVTRKCLKKPLRRR